MLGNRNIMIYYKVMSETDNHNDLALIGASTFLRPNWKNNPKMTK